MYKYQNGDLGKPKQLKIIHQIYFSKLADAPMTFSWFTDFNNHIRTQSEEKEKAEEESTRSKQTNDISNIHYANVIIISYAQF